MPQQVFPLTVFHPSVVSLMRRVLSTSKTFGIVNLQADSSDWKVITTVKWYMFIKSFNILTYVKIIIIVISMGERGRILHILKHLPISIAFPGIVLGKGIYSGQPEIHNNKN